MAKKQFSIKLIAILLIAVFLKQLLWVGIVPLWHFPDEQAHFAQIQNTAEKGPQYSSSSDEIAITEQLLKTFRTSQGRNSYTLQPWFNIPYTNNYQGQYEQQIRDLPSFTRNLSELKLNESTSYPFLYYLLSAGAYKLVNNSDLMTRDFAVRTFSAILFTINIYIVWLIGRHLAKLKLFEKLPKQLVPLTLTTITAFHPMFSFVGASPNSDVLFNLLFTLFIYGCILLLDAKNQKQTNQAIIITVASIILGLLTKQQMVIALAIIPFVAVYRFKDIISCIKKYQRATIFTSIIAVTLIYIATRLGEVQRIIGFLGKDLQAHPVNLFDHLKWSLETTYRQTLPWYWGVYRWLSLTLPRWVNRVQMVILLFTGIGTTIFIVMPFINKSKFTKNLKTFLTEQNVFLFFLYTSAVYYFFVIGWDWLHRMGKGFSFGVQGRYFFPTIVAHMAIIIIGITALSQVLTSLKRSYRTPINPKYVLITLGIWFIALNAIAIWTVSASYYDHSSLHAFLIQASQYKPDIFKGSWWYLWIGLYTTSSGIFAYLITQPNKKN